VIEPGEKVPSVPVFLRNAEGHTQTTSDAVLGQGLVVFFSVTGAFTPTCHVNHLPGFLANVDKLRAAGVARIVCASANDHHVLGAWAKDTGATGIIDFISDPKGELARAMGLERTTDDLGLRFRRSAIVFRDGVAEHVFVEDKPGVNATGAPAVLVALAEAA
jgi:peroxiredoxin